MYTCVNARLCLTELNGYSLMNLCSYDRTHNMMSGEFIDDRSQHRNHLASNSGEYPGKLIQREGHTDYGTSAVWKNHALEFSDR